MVAWKAPRIGTRTEMENPVTANPQNWIPSRSNVFP